VSEVFVPASEAEACDCIASARSDKRTLEIVGGGTRAGLGRPVHADAVLSTQGLRGVTLYEPAELVLSAWAGTPLAEIEALLAGKQQILPFEPMDHRALYGAHGEPTIGAVAACNISGPRRVRAGAARDSLIGVRFVNGRGEAVKSGGRVMKNVTGLDLVKLSCGAHGTLGLLSEVTFKLLPAPRGSGTLVIEGLNDEQAIAVMALALGSPFEVSAAAHIPSQKRTLLRIEQAPDSLTYRLEALTGLAKPFGPARRLSDNEAHEAWANARDAAPLADSPAAALWRVSVAPSRASAFVNGLRTQNIAQDWFYDWGGGLIWLTSDLDWRQSEAIFTAAALAKGHAMLVRAPEDARAKLPIFQPQPEAMMTLSARVKASMDPDGILNPGRMYAGV
jgi:glycolate oxidase FAD binding subunit